MSIQTELERTGAEIDRLAEKQLAHKKAFRLCFDLLRKYYPPQRDVEYWKTLALEISMIDAQNGNEPLCQEMLLTIFNYLEEEMPSG